MSFWKLYYILLCLSNFLVPKGQQNTVNTALSELSVLFSPTFITIDFIMQSF